MIRRPLILARLLALLLALTAAMPALAQEKLTVADCGSAGCRCALSPLTLAEAELVLGQPAPAGTATLVRHGGAYVWSPLSLQEIDLIAGGDGECPLELFQSMVPEDGQWLGVVTGQSISECPPGLEAALTPVTAAMALQHDITWGGSFHPDRMRAPNAVPPIAWTRVDDRHFTGQGPAVSESGPGTLVRIGVTYDARLIDPRLVRVLVRLTINSDGASQAIINAAGLGRCDVRVTVDLARSGG